MDCKTGTGTLHLKTKFIFMKRLINTLLLTLSLLVFFPISAHADGRVIPFSGLPTEAQSFIKTHFANVKVLQVTKEFAEYEVTLADRSKLEFDRSGNWKKVNCRGSAIPESVIPSRIQTYINDNYSSDNVRTIERNILGYEVKLSSGFELKFDKNCNFKRIDD